MGGSNIGAALGDSPCCAFSAEAGCRLCRWLRYPANRSALLSPCQRCEANLRAHPLCPHPRSQKIMWIGVMTTRIVQVQDLAIFELFDDSRHTSSELAQIDLLGPCAFR